MVKGMRRGNDSEGMRRGKRGHEAGKEGDSMRWGGGQGKEGKE